MNNNPIKHCDTSGHCIDGLTTIPCLIALITVAGFSGGAAIYQFNVSGNSWWESTEDVIATTKAGFEGMFLAVGAALTAGQVALLAPDAAMWLGAKSNNTGLFSWGVNQAALIQQTNIITNKISNNEKAISNQFRDTVYNDEVRSPYPIRPSKIIDAWENFLGEGPYNNIGPNNNSYLNQFLSRGAITSNVFGSAIKIVIST